MSNRRSLLNNCIFFFTILLTFGFVGCTHKTVRTSSLSTGNNSSKDSLSVSDCQKCIVFTEKAPHQGVAIADVAQNGKIIWEWHPQNSNIDKSKVNWFLHIDEAKPVYNLKYILITSSKEGGVALIRIKGKKVVWYAHAGSNAHSAEILPDGNIVVACATPVNSLIAYHVDTTQTLAAKISSVIKLNYAHNAVWDKKGKSYGLQLEVNFILLSITLIVKVLI